MFPVCGQTGEGAKPSVALGVPSLAESRLPRPRAAAHASEPRARAGGSPRSHTFAHLEEPQGRPPSGPGFLRHQQPASRFLFRGTVPVLCPLNFSRSPSGALWPSLERPGFLALRSLCPTRLRLQPSTPLLRFCLSPSDLGCATHGQPRAGDPVEDGVGSRGADEGGASAFVNNESRDSHTRISLMPCSLSGCFHGIVVILKELLFFLALSRFLWE